MILWVSRNLLGELKKKKKSAVMLVRSVWSTGRLIYPQGSKYSILS